MRIKPTGDKAGFLVETESGKQVAGMAIISTGELVSYVHDGSYYTWTPVIPNITAAEVRRMAELLNEQADKLETLQAGRELAEKYKELTPEQQWEFQRQTKTRQIA